MFNKLRKGHWPIFLLNSLSSLGNMFLPLILVRLLSLEEVGYYKIFYLYLMALPFLFMAGGPTHSVFYWVGQKGEDKEYALNATWIWTLLLSILILCVGYPFREFIALKLGLPQDYVILMLLAGCLWCPSGHYSESSIAFGKSAKGSLFDTAFEFIKTAAFILIAWKFKDIRYLFIFHPALMLSKLIIGTYLNQKEHRVSFRTNRKSFYKVFKYFIPVSFAGCLSFFVEKLDLIILSGVLDTTSFAFYSMGCLIIPPLFLLEMSVQKVLIPNLASSCSNHKKKSGVVFFREAIKNISFLTIPAVFGLFIFAEPIVSLLYTDQYAESAIYLKIFSLSYLLLMFPHDSVARASGKTSWILKMYLIITPVSMIAGYYCAKYWGPIGILIMSIVVKLITKIYGLNFSRKLMGWKWNQMFPTKLLLNYLMMSSVLSLGSYSMKNLFETDLQWFLFCSPIFAIIYITFFNFKLLRINHATKI